MFMIGVTGHRDLSPAGVGDVGHAINELLIDLQSRLPRADIALMSGPLCHIMSPILFFACVLF